MNKLKYLLSLAIVFSILPNKIYAECTKEEISYFKEVEDDYKITYELNNETKTYNITFYNKEPDKYILNATDNNLINNCNFSNLNELKCKNAKPGKYTIDIVSMNQECEMIFKTITLNLSMQNNYYNDPLCEGIEEFVLCQETYDKEIDYDTFVSRVNTYKKTKARETAGEEEKNNNQKNEIIDKVINYINQNAPMAIAAIFVITIIIIAIVSIAKSIRKSRRLE